MISKAIRKNSILLSFISIFIFGIIGWYKIFDSWFLYVSEQNHLLRDPSFAITSLIRNHALIYYLSYKLFGWDPQGWYGITLILHLITSWLGYILLSKLTKNRLLSFYITLIFVVNIAYVDVVAWGSFNALYAFTLGVFVGSIILFYQFRKTKKIFFYLAIFPTIILGLLMREMTILLPLFIFFLDCIFFNGYRKYFIKRDLREAIKIYLPMFVVVLIFLVFRHYNGGDPVDYVDERHRLRLSLIANHQFVEYFFRSFLGFTKKFADQVIPYPALNWIRDGLPIAMQTKFIQNYFFPTIGLILFIFSFYMLLRYRKEKYFKVMLFFSLFVIISNIFFSTAMPDTDTTLPLAYGWNGARYSYFAFFGFNIFLGLLIYIIIKKHQRVKKIGIMLAIFWIIIQVIMVRNTIIKLNKEVYGPAKSFHTYMKTHFPDSDRLHFYIPPHTSPLGDFFLEWYLIQPSQHKRQGYEVGTGNIALLLEKLKKGTVLYKNVRFLDYNPSIGVIDRTKETQKIFNSVKETTFLWPSDYKFSLTKQYPVEIPYVIEMKIRVNNSTGENSDFSKYLFEKYDFLKNSNLEVSDTILNSDIETHPNFSKDNLTDNTLGNKSSWGSHSTSPWIIVDLKKIKDITGVLWSCPGETNRPGVYTISVSSDKKSWKKILHTVGNSSCYHIDLFPSMEKARFVKMNIISTVNGTQANIDEIEAVGPNGKKIVAEYKNIKILMEDVITKANSGTFQSPFIFAQLDVFTKSPSMVEENIKNFMIPKDDEYHILTIPINDSEEFSQPGEFLKRKISGFTFSFPKTAEYSIEYVKIKPKYDINSFLKN
ncbi:MAG: discoidin domain-containing protein [Candidatus Levybacteria bacterium]|nr:discoidin domain-containing protein [Candidatus Levybacteria bacterium]